MTQYVMTICHPVFESRFVNLGKALVALDRAVNKLELDVMSISDQFYPEISIEGNKSEPMIARTIVYKSETGPRRY